jgi:hypothetical protein
VSVFLELEPISGAAGDRIVVRARDASVRRADVARVTGVETAWFATMPMTPAEDGTSEGWFDAMITEECVEFGMSVGLEDGSTLPVESNGVALNPSQPIVKATDVEGLRARLESEQSARYDQPIGDPQARGVIEHRVLCVIERLLIGTHYRLPGVHVLPVPRRPDGTDQFSLLNEFTKDIGWNTVSEPAISLDEWKQRVERERPWTAIACPSVFAADFADAARLAREQRDLVIAVLGLARGARGRPVATVVQQRQPDDTINVEWFLDDGFYGGNLLSGVMAGESQRALLADVSGMEADPLLAVLVGLYADALSDPSADARYLRLWSILETLSGARVAASVPVTLLDGSPFPGGGTTSQAAPRVYKFLADRLLADGWREAVLASPASSLYEAVRAWYARRNATGHYGRFDMSDPRQSQQSWMQWAQLTTIRPGEWDRWLRALQDCVEKVLRAEVADAGAPLI